MIRRTKIVRAMLAAVVAAVLAVVAETASAGVLGYWNFDGTYTNQFGPAADGVNSGTTFSNAYPAAVGSGQSAYWDAASDKITIPGDPTGTSTNWTLAFFVKVEAADYEWNRLAQHNSASPYLAIGYHSTSDFKVQIAEPWWQQATNTVATQGTWVHLAFLANGGAGTLSIYRNGTLTDTETFTAAATAGSLYLGGSALTTEGMRGLMDDVLLTDDNLSAEQIAFIANNGAAYFARHGRIAPRGTVIIVR